MLAAGPGARLWGEHPAVPLASWVSPTFQLSSPGAVGARGPGCRSRGCWGGRPWGRRVRWQTASQLTFPVPENYAQHWCSLLTDPAGAFSRCHSVLNPAPFYSVRPPAPRCFPGSRTPQHVHGSVSPPLGHRGCGCWCHRGAQTRSLKTREIASGPSPGGQARGGQGHAPSYGYRPSSCISQPLEAPGTPGLVATSPQPLPPCPSPVPVSKFRAHPDDLTLITSAKNLFPKVIFLGPGG